MSSNQITVLIQNHQDVFLAPSKSVEILHLPPSQLVKAFPLSDVQRLIESALNLFVLTSATGLPDVADIVRYANQKHRLRGLFIKEDIDPKWLPQMFDRANLRVMNKTFVYANSELPQRVINAWAMSAQDQLIADATVIGDRLFVLSCAMEKFEIPFSSLTALRQIPPENWRKFIVADDGSYLYWEAEDVHIDLDFLRYAKDTEWKQNFKALELIHDQILGTAIARIRKLHKLRQADILGLSERQVSRIEQSEAIPTIAALKLFAKAHGMEINDYLNAVAEEYHG